MKKKKISLASDHAGYPVKELIKKFLIDKNYEIKDFGTDSEESADYPDFAHPLAKSVENGESDFGFTFCGSGNGISMTVNKYQYIRAALCWNEEIAALARQHNDANVCSIPARFVSEDKALKIAEKFLNSEFEGGRHQRRVGKIPVK